MRARLVLIDDEKDILKVLEYNFRKEGYEVLSSRNGSEGLKLVQAQVPDLVVLDLMLPGLDGLEVCKILKSDPKTRRIPILMLTAKSTEADQIVGLELGADGYGLKTFSVQGLWARAKNRLMRRHAAQEHAAVLRAGKLALDSERQKVTVKGREVELTGLEFRILKYCMERRGKVLARNQVLDGAWKGEAFVVDRTVDAHVKSIRDYLFQGN